ncbi:MAG: FAD-dependent oxidoreductase [bacterium]|nr:FAD-dependent oxidoreductase [bacterium]
MSDVTDIVIVGYGPAGMTAALYAARKQLTVTLIGELPGGEVRNSGDIENWIGDRKTDGNTLADKMIEHVKDHSDMVTTILGKVASITKESPTPPSLPSGRGGALFVTTTEDGKEFRSKAVIYTAGRHPRMLNIPGEKEFKNLGVTYCATCDAPLFEGKDVVVIGGGNSGAEAVIMLQKIAKRIYVLQDKDQLIADPVLIANFDKDPKVTITTNAQTLNITGDTFVTGLTYKDKTTNIEHKLDVQGIFVTIGAIPNTAPIQDFIELDPLRAIPADRYGITSIPGFFAAGDVTTIRDAQIVVAAGQGCSAALSAGDYISRL